MINNKIKLIGLSLVLGLLSSVAHADGPKVSYKVGSGTTIENDDFKLKISNRTQVRYTYDMLDDVAGDGVDGTKDKNTFAVQRNKFALEGFTLADKIRFKMQMNLATRAKAETDSGTGALTKESTTGLATLEDAWLDYVPYYYFGVQAGQFKAPYLKQQLTSSGKQQFVDRSLATGFFDYGYDIGANIHGNLLEKKINYAVFAINGDGVNTINANQGHILGTRWEFIPLGEYASSESDIDDSQDPNLGFGVAYAYSDQGASSFQNKMLVSGDRSHNVTVDAGFKYKGFSFQGAGMLTRKFEDFLESGVEFTNWGYNAQVGYFFVPKKFEVALRTDGVAFSDDTDALFSAQRSKNQYEHSIGLNYFIVGHGIKLQADYSLLQNSASKDGGREEVNDSRIRTQFQVIF